MGYDWMMGWGIVKKFLLGWGITFLVLVIFSCVKYREFISTALGNNMLSLLNAVMPLAIMIFVLFYLLRSIFR